MKRPIALVDAFADRPFAGNPAGVMILDAALPEDVMQAVAAEMAQAETAFAVPRGDGGGDGGWDLRWFSPTQEVAFCGHATLATAHVLAEEGRAGDLLAFHTAAGVLRVGMEGDGRYALDLPRIDPESTKLWELPFGVEGYRGAFMAGEALCIEVENEKYVRGFRPDFGLIAEYMAGGLCLTAPGYGADVVSRFFWPAGGIPEDQVTGSLHATLAPYWAERLKTDRLTAEQASRRGGRLGCHVTPERVILTGSAVTTLRGEIVLPD